jgi:all-trans-retinol 13,14-reductase
MKPSKLRIGRRYRPNRLDPGCDAVVIGSGMGGLTTAAILSELGWKVCVLEQHYTAGGYTHSFERNGYEWDPGVHYIGDVGAETTTRKMFDFVSEGRLKWAPMDPEYDRFYVGKKVFNAVAGKQEFRDNLVRQFPAEEQAIDRYLQLLSKSAKATTALGLERILRPWQRILLWPLLRLLKPAWVYRNTYDVLSELTDNADLIAVLCGQWGDMGLPPKRSPFMMHAMIARHYLHGGFYPVGGSWQIAKSIIPKIQKAGGEVFTYASVEEILVMDGKVTGVRMADGHEIECECVISSAGVGNTFDKLLPKDLVHKLGYTRRLPNVQPSFAHLGVYIGLKHTAEELGIPKTNFWIYPSNDYDAAVDKFIENEDSEFPVVYISFPSAKDPDYQSRNPGTATIEIVAPAPFEWFEQWQNSTWGKRGNAYETFKAELGERLMKHLYDKLPQVEGKVDYFEVSTPQSTNWFCAYQHGELYGLDHTAKRLKQNWLGPRTPIKGLWMTGQDTLTCGVTGAMMSGMLTVTAMVGMRKMRPVMKQIGT